MLQRVDTHLLRFGVFEFDPKSGDLRKAGRRIRLQNQPRQVLKLLVSRPGELVTREELQRELWPGDTFVDFENGVNVAVRKIRDALGDVTPSPRFIETERAQGYRFIAPVTELRFQPASLATAEIPGTSEPRRIPTRLVGALAAAVVIGTSLWLWRGVLQRPHPAPEEFAAPISVAILPLAATGGETEEFLAIGIPDGIITRLSNVRGLRVRPTRAVAAFQDTAIDIQEIGRRLASEYVLMGTIRATGNRVRVSVQLVRAKNVSPVWGATYDVARADLLGIEDAAAEQISKALHVRLSDVERERLYRRYTRNVAAYERYLRGRAQLRALTHQGALRAISEFEAARDLDGKYALAYAGLATAAAQLRVRFTSNERDEVWGVRAREEAHRALAIDPELAEAHEALAAVHRFQEYDWDAVIRESQRALELNPSLDMPHLYLAVAYFHIGLLQDAETEVRAARNLNVLNRVEPLEILGAIHLFSGRFDDALGQLSQVYDSSDSRIVRYLFGWALYYQGRREPAEAQLEAMINDEGPLASNARATLAAIRAARGATSSARALADRVASEPDLIHHGAYGLGTAYAQLEDAGTAVRWLSQAAVTGFPCYPWFERDPLLDPIRTDLRFVDFMTGVRRSWEEARARYSEKAGTVASASVAP
jgi:TolB-like protein/DNA-binding winged helix-turn-helix (wHTH) protein